MTLTTSLPLTYPLPCPPLYGTPRSLERPTLGPKVGEISARLGKRLHPYQQYMADVAGEIDPDTGLLAYDQIVVIGPRQIGKTELILPEMTHRCVGFDAELAAWSRAEFGHEVTDPGAQRVLYAAQTADVARAKWRDTHLPRLLRAPQIRKLMANPRGEHGGARLRMNAEAILWRNGSSWSPTSTTGKTGGTSDTVDMGVVDEGWSHDARIELAMLPTMDTRPWSQLWVVSMIPGLSRAQPGTWKWLHAKREVGRARVAADVRYGMAFFDFSAPEGADPGDPATWRAGHPGIGYTTTEAKIRARFAGLPLADFCAEYLGWAPGAAAPRWTLIDRDTWRGLWDPSSSIEGQAALALEVSEDRTRAWIGAAGYRADGHWHVEVVEPGFRVPAETLGMDWLLSRTLDIVAEQDICTVVIDPRRPANSLIVPLRRAGVDVLTPNQVEIAGACGRFYDATGQEVNAETDTGVRVFHLGQHELDGALAAARRFELGGGAFVFIAKGTRGVEPLYLITLAMHGHDVKSVKRVPEPEIFV